MQEPAITPELVASHGINESEYKLIEQILGRAPNYTELGIFSVMWSEHCSYKSSRIHLRKFPTSGPRVVQGPGENAGVMVVFCVVFVVGVGLISLFIYKKMLARREKRQSHV